MAHASKSLARRRRPDAVVRAEHHRPAAPLTGPEKKLLEEAVRLGVELQAKTEASLLAYGAWLLQNVPISTAVTNQYVNPVVALYVVASSLW